MGRVCKIFLLEKKKTSFPTFSPKYAFSANLTYNFIFLTEEGTPLQDEPEYDYNFDPVSFGYSGCNQHGYTQEKQLYHLQFFLPSKFGSTPKGKILSFVTCSFL